MTRRHMLWVLAAAALAGCGISEAKGGNEVTIDLSAVTLGDDCGPPPPPPPVQQPVAPAKLARRPATPGVVAPSEAPFDAAAPAARCAPGVRCGGGGGCNQTSMQLSITAAAGTKPTTVKVSKVELLDAKGKVLEVLTAREPTRWLDGTYAAWDQTLDAKQHVKASYALAAPNWTKHTNGRWNAHSKTFQLRVTMSVGTGTRTVMKQAITAARLPPAVPT